MPRCPCGTFLGGKSWLAQCMETQGETFSLLSPPPCSLMTWGGDTCLEAPSQRFCSAFPREAGLYDSALLQWPLMTALEPCRELAPDLAEVSQPESVLCNCSLQLQRAPTELAARWFPTELFPCQTSGEFTWQRGTLHQPCSWE